MRSQIHVHCFTDTPEFALGLLDHFPNLHIGITGLFRYLASFYVNTHLV